MKRRSFFQRVLGAFGAAIVADKVVAKNDITVVPNTTITGTQGMYATPTVTPSIIPSPTPSVTRYPQPSPRVIDGYSEFWRWDYNTGKGRWVRDLSSKK